jgi:hypothetical protein
MVYLTLIMRRMRFSWYLIGNGVELALSVSETIVTSLFVENFKIRTN